LSSEEAAVMAILEQQLKKRNRLEERRNPGAPVADKAMHPAVAGCNVKGHAIPATSGVGEWEPSYFFFLPVISSYFA
jgi:hypothetical protein